MITATIRVEREQLEAAIARMGLYGDECFAPLQRALESATFGEPAKLYWITIAVPGVTERARLGPRAWNEAQTASVGLARLGLDPEVEECVGGRP